MQVNSDFAELLRIFNANGCRYLIVGAYAVAYYAEPRYTKDLDIWIEPSAENASRVYHALLVFGAPLTDLQIADLHTPGIVYQIGIEPIRVDILTSIDPLAFAQAYQDSTQTTFDGVPVTVLGIDDLMRAKQSANRPQDRLDLERLDLVKSKR